MPDANVPQPSIHHTHVFSSDRESISIPDAEALEQIYDVLIHEGLSVGTSAGINIAAAIRVARSAAPSSASHSSEDCW